MGTFVAVEAVAATHPAAEAGLEAAFAAISTVDRLMHPSRAGGDLAAIASAPCGAALPIHEWTWEVLDLSRRLAECTQGEFDPCLGSAQGRIGDLDLSRRGYAVPLLPVHLDLGGIAKGFAVDRAIEALRSSGCEGGLVNAGGDLAAFGAHLHRIVCRESAGDAFTIELNNAALAASDTEQSNRPVEHRGYYHGAKRLHAITGSATIVARSAAIADALTKCALASGGELDPRMLDTFDARIVHYAQR